MAEFTKEREIKGGKGKTPKALAASEETVPITHHYKGKSKTSGSTSAAAAAGGGGTEITESSDTSFMMGAMKAGFAGVALSKPKKKDKGLTTSILSSIAEDPEFASEYTAKGSTIDGDLVTKVSSKYAKGVENAIRSIRKAQRVSLLFLLDTTGSMRGHITGVKLQIKHIIKSVQDSGCKVDVLSFVGYKDHCDGPNHFEILPFTKNVSDFESFLDGVNPTGGGDEPEDVIGGLKKAIDMDWSDKSGTKIIFHLGDAPPHGKGTYHNSRDDYEAGHPSDVKLPILFSSMKQKEIMYYFGKINSSTDRMIQVFESHYGKIDTFDTKEVAKISECVTASVMKSVGIRSGVASSAKAISKHEYSFVKDEPDWGTLPKLKGTIVSFKLPEDIESIKRFDKLEQDVNECTIQVAPHPFACGMERAAFHGKMHYKDYKSGSVSVDDVVFKELIHKAILPDLDRQRYMVSLEVQTVASKLAFEFNDRIQRTTASPGIKIKFLVAKVVRVTQPDGTYRFMAEEKRFRGEREMIKLTNNSGFIRTLTDGDEESRKRLELAVAFSHFSHKHTDGYLMIADLQGTDTIDSKKRPTLLLTDPAIHCPGLFRFGGTNLQQEGIIDFYKTHRCNKYCTALGLNRWGPEGEK